VWWGKNKRLMSEANATDPVAREGGSTFFASFFSALKKEVPGFECKQALGTNSAKL